MLRKLAFVPILIALVGTAAVPAQAHPFDPGYYYATGTVRPLGFSIYMQGTHTLESASGSLIALLSSDVYDLAKYEGAKVKVLGWTEHSVEGSTVHMDVISLTVLAAPSVKVPFTILSQAAHTGWRTSDPSYRSIVIRDDATWQLFYNEHSPGSTAPKVDFTKHQVLGAFAGVKPTGGYSIAITDVLKTGTGQKVTTKSTSPAPGTIVTMALTNPFCLAKTLRNSGIVTFNGKKARVLKVADFKTNPDALLVLGHVSLATGIDPAKVKVGVFSMDARARYFAWPGLFPGSITPVDPFTGVFLKEVVPGAPSPYVGYTVIVWADGGGDGTTGGDPLATTESYTWSGGSTWTGDAGDKFPGFVRVELSLTTSP